MIFKKTALIFLILITGLSCGSDDAQFQEPELTTEDFLVTIDESPESGLILGNIEATTNVDQLTFTILEQNEQIPFSINEDSGELRVENNLLFNFEVNQSLTATVLINNSEIEETINVVVQLNDTDFEQERKIVSQASSFTRIDYFYQGDVIDRMFFGEDMAPGLVHNFIYDGERVSQMNIINTDESGENRYFFAYDVENRITEIQFEDNLDPAENYTYVFNYNGASATVVNQETAEVIQFTFNTSGDITSIFTDEDSIELVYEDSNLISEKVTINGNINQRFFLYDNLRNPENHPRFEYVKKVQLYRYYLERRYRLGNFVSTYRSFYSLMNNKNNVIGLSDTQNEDSPEFNLNYSYNLNDYPIIILDLSEPYSYTYQ